MSSLKQLSANQLSKMLNETQAELKRRENINKAHKEIQNVMKKYKITISDLDLGDSSKKSDKKKVSAKKVSAKKASAKKASAKKASAKKAGIKKGTAKASYKDDQRAVVAAKYHNAATGDKWSGRGRTPVWVTNLCAAESIGVKQFKADPRFRI